MAEEVAVAAAVESVQLEAELVAGAAAAAAFVVVVVVEAIRELGRPE